MSFEPTELVINVDELPWVPMGVGSWGKVLRTCPETGSWTIMFKQEAGTFAPPHKHLAAADFYVLKGRIEYRGGVASAGYFAREPLNAVHEKTTFPEEAIYLFTSSGPLAMYGPDGNIASILDAESLQALIEPERRAQASG
jgi:anti-sigma factor ChrR (cupin superfamily)